MAAAIRTLRQAISFGGQSSPARARTPIVSSTSTVRQRDQVGSKRRPYGRAFCWHGFATAMLRDVIDPKTVADLGDGTTLPCFMETYAHAIKDAKLMDGLFGTKLTQPKSKTRKMKGIDR